MTPENDAGSPPLLLCNPGYGNNPYLRCTQIALAVNERRRGRGEEPYRIAVPLLYGDRQRKILEEEFGKRPEVVLDEVLGEIIAPLLYGKEAYETFLQRWLDRVDATSEDVRTRIAKIYGGATLEIARAPLVETGVHPSYAAGFARGAEILERACGETRIHVDRSLLRRGALRMRALEERYDRFFLTEPGTFPTTERDDAMPPTATLKETAAIAPSPSAYVTASGIPGMERLYAFAASLGMPVYSNDPAAVPGSKRGPPQVLGHENIVVHVARAGWGAIWASLLSGTPLIVADYDPTDDPEMFFNIRRIEELRLGVVHRGQEPEELLRQALALQPGIIEYRESLRKRFGTLDGARFMAERICP